MLLGERWTENKMTWAPNGSLGGLSPWMGDPDFTVSQSHNHLTMLRKLC